MSEISLILVLQKITNKTLNDMAKVQIKSVNLDCVPPAESRPLFSSSSLFLRNGLRHHAGMY